MALQSVQLDEVDERVVRELQVDGRVTLRELARRLHLSAPALSERVRRLEERGVIQGYGARISPVHVGLPILAFVRMTSSGPDCARVAEFARQEDAVLECHRLTGEDCFLLKVAVRDLGQLEAMIDTLSQFGKPTTSLALSTVVDSSPVTPAPREL